MKTGTLHALALFLLALVSPAVIAQSAAAPAPAAPASEPGWLGVSLGTSDAEPGVGMEGAAEGVKVIGIAHGSPAQKAGLRVRDIILSINGEPVSTPREMIAIVTSLPPGASLTLNVLRKGQERLVTPSLESRPTDAALTKMFNGWIGVEAIDLPPSLRQHFGAPVEAGVMISAVHDGSPAEAAGLDVGDVVFEVDGEPVHSLSTLRNLIASSGIDNRIELRVMRNGAEVVLEPLVTSRPERDDAP